MPNRTKINAAPIDKSKTNPETQEIFDMFIINGMELLYDENQAKSVLPRIGANEDSTKVIAEILVDVITRVVSSAKSAGKKIPPEVVLHGGNFLFAELLKVLEAAGMESLTEEQKTAIWQMASSIYIDQAVQSGEITEQELMVLKQQIEQTEEGKKVMKTAENPEAAVKGLDKPPVEDTVIPAEAASASMAAPVQGGM